MNIQLKKLHPEAKIPTYSHSTDAGFDLYTIQEVTLQPMELKIIQTGIAINIPNGYVGFIWDKSGLANKHQIKTVGGVYDAEYTGEITVGAINLSNVPYTFEKGHKIAQMIIQQRVVAEFEEVEDFGEVTRGEKRHGSTGK